MPSLQKGLSLIELMIGMTIGILMLVVLSALLSNNTQARAELDQTMQQVENGRYAMQMMTTELRHAGYYGEGSSVGKAPVAVPDPCATVLADQKTALPIAVQGFSQPAASPLGCLNNANFKANTDILVVRRALTGAVAAASLDPGAPYIQSLGTSFVFDSGANATSFNLTTKAGAPADIHPYAVQIYFISPCSKPAAGNDCSGAADDGGYPRPTLKRLDLTAAGWQATALVEGIDNMVVEYGIDTDKDGSADVYKNEAADITEWSNVVAVRMHLLARNTRQTGNYKDEKVYNLGPAVVLGPFNDKYKRHAYSEVVRLMNVSGRREE